MNKSICVIFGGTGFIGCHFANLLLSQNIYDKVVLADIKGIDEERFSYFLNDFVNKGKIEFVQCDVRVQIPLNITGNVDLVFHMTYLFFLLQSLM